MASKVDIVSNALLLIGHPAISSFDADQGAGATVGAALFDSTLRYMLSTTYWRFSVKQQSLNRMTQHPIEGYKYAFQIPSDAITIYRLRPRCMFQVFEDKIYTNVESAIADYTYQVEPTQLPLYFTHVMQYKLAADFAISITNDPNKHILYDNKYKEELPIAMTADAKNHPQEGIQDNPFSDVRFYGQAEWGYNG